MTGKHFDDLTAIDCPFGMLDECTQERLKAAKPVQVFNRDWVEINSELFWNGSTYRAKPQPPLPLPPGLGKEWRWIAMDESGGVYVFTNRPKITELTWHSDRGFTRRLDDLFPDLYADWTGDWRQSLTERKD